MLTLVRHAAEQSRIASSVVGALGAGDEQNCLYVLANMVVKKDDG
jgi:hypothetical protein